MNTKQNFDYENSFNNLSNYIFGDKPSIYIFAIGGAYSDMARRTSKGDKWKKSNDEKKSKWKKAVAHEIIEKGIKSLLDNGPKEKWHFNICEDIKDNKVKDKELSGLAILSYGQAQKWLNMTLKNMYISGLFYKKFTKCIVDELHCPIDRYIIDAANYIGIERPKNNDGNDCSSWSLLDNYDEYNRFQIELGKKLGNKISRIEWEMKVWPIYREEYDENDKKIFLDDKNEQHHKILSDLGISIK